jgi:hypothetical protein
MKSFLKGSIAGSLLALCGTSLVTLAQSATVSNPGFQRYILYQNVQFRADQFLVDTASGKVWQLCVSKDGTNSFQRCATE